MEEAIREVADLERTKFAELRVDAGDRSVEGIARMVRDQADNWLGLT